MRSHQIGTCGQCDQIGQFIKFLETKFQTKEAQIIINSLGYFEKPHNYVKTSVATSWVTFENIWATFTPASGHTACGAIHFILLNIIHFWSTYHLLKSGVHFEMGKICRMIVQYLHILHLSISNMERAVVVAQLAEQLLLIPEARSSNPVTGKIF